MNTPKQLKGLFSLSMNIKLFIPGTINITEDATEQQLTFVNNALKLFADNFGGATSYKAVGAWSSPSAGLVTENVVIVEAFCSPDAVEIHMDSVLKLAEQIKKEMSQDAVAMSYNNQIYFI